MPSCSEEKRNSLEYEMSHIKGDFKFSRRWRFKSWSCLL